VSIVADMTRSELAGLQAMTTSTAKGSNSDVVVTSAASGPVRPPDQDGEGDKALSHLQIVVGHRRRRTNGPWLMPSQPMALVFAGDHE
jgi:hypothetical protein